MEIMPAAPGKIPMTLNIPVELKRKVGIEAEKRGIRKGDLISKVLTKHLDEYLLQLDSPVDSKDG
ncbi:hypothetical protein DSM107003_37540 [Trichormus variabilis SAG 1403-4b]|uniref:Uncharacterized protein n=1 Tax=Trichormus variabilis SAG 1403-4b TaxID=447716 RepID=A0A3S5K2W6_ANAVA|nr:hypothetical protein DSM107003_37540 [Trichormus variabilis SAG 1403-4b]